ncbi:rpa-interacting protein [Lynx pardinus]|uniref:Rpa-interacting protein n=1 Tax=Lynx pardinus TaxID=191816 RepID=A0A485N629_LYNPA|nr:rpa-interacting protein [Lynx pardinus]
MAEAPGSGRRSLYKAAGSPSWKEAFRQRMRNSRDRLLNRYRQAGGGVPGSAQSTLLVHEVMEEEWSALRSVEGRPEVSAQLEEPVDLAVLEEIQQELADQGEWLHLPAPPPDTAYLERSADPGLLAAVLCDPDSASRSNLRVANGVVTCPCGLYLSNHFPELTEQKLRACIEDSVNAHSAHCPHTPEFSVTQATGERPTLLMSCLACDTWTAIL